MLYFSRLLNACGFAGLTGLILMQRDVDGSLLISGFHGLGLAALLAFVAACLNFRGALSAAYMEPGK